MNRRSRRLLWESLGKPIFRGAITILMSVGWFILSAIIFQWWLPQFPAYVTTIKNAGWSQNDVWYIWAWIPTIGILVLGIFWASGIFGAIGRVLSKI